MLTVAPGRPFARKPEHEFAWVTLVKEALFAERSLEKKSQVHIERARAVVDEGVKRKIDGRLTKYYLGTTAYASLAIPRGASGNPAFSPTIPQSNLELGVLAKAARELEGQANTRLVVLAPKRNGDVAHLTEVDARNAWIASRRSREGTHREHHRTEAGTRDASFAARERKAHCRAGCST